MVLDSNEAPTANTGSNGNGAEHAVENHQKTEVLQNIAEMNTVTINPDQNPVNKSWLLSSSLDPVTDATRITAKNLIQELKELMKTTNETNEGGSEKKNFKLIHFVRHGEGFHNVAQREYRARPEYDGVGEPYTIETDPEWKHRDALLTEKGMDF